MATKKKKATKSESKNEKRKAKLESTSDIVNDFLQGMKQDKDAPGAIGIATHETKIHGFISTGSATLDCAIGRPGIPLSRVTILHGKEGGGKTTVALEAIAEVQRAGGLGVYIDKEHKLDRAYAQKLGVDLSRLIEPREIETLEKIVAVIHATIRRAKEIRKKTKQRVPILIVVDSLNACKAIETIDTPTGKKRYPAEARIWSEELPGIVEAIDDEAVGLVFVSQVRKKMNVMFGNDEEMAGGNAPRFYASLIVYIQRIGTEKQSEGAKKEKVGSIVEAECKKNQIAPPFKKAKFVIYWNRGIDYEHSLVLQLEEMGIVKKRGQGYLELKRGKGKTPVQLGQGYPAAAEFLRSKPNLRDKLRGILFKKMGWKETA